MFKSLLIGTYLVLLSGLTSKGQEKIGTEAISDFFRNGNIEMIQEVTTSLEENIKAFKSLRSKTPDEKRFLKKLFYRIQSEYLLNYKGSASLLELFEDAKAYDCVTGTALYALVLDALDIDYSIKETDFHIYLLVHLHQKDILFETTDPLHGFVDNPVVINDRIKLYREGENASEMILTSSTSDNTFFTIPYRIDRVISLSNLAGLQYYNLALAAYNAGSHSSAESFIDLAISLYPNNRFFGFKEIVQIDMAQSMSALYQNR